jgi:predicted KAP-like P-loop ATPase
MHFARDQRKSKRYISGKGFVYSDKVGNLYNSAKQRIPTMMKPFELSPSIVQRKIEGAIQQGVSDVKGSIPVASVDTVKKAVKSNIKNLVHKGDAIPNAEAILKEVVSSVPVQEIKKVVKGKGVHKDRPLSELLAKHKPTAGKGIRLHGEGMYLHGTGFKYA